MADSPVNSPPSPETPNIGSPLNGSSSSPLPPPQTPPPSSSPLSPSSAPPPPLNNSSASSPPPTPPKQKTSPPPPSSSPPPAPPKQETSPPPPSSPPAAVGNPPPQAPENPSPPPVRPQPPPQTPSNQSPPPPQIPSPVTPQPPPGTPSNQSTPSQRPIPPPPPPSPPGNRDGSPPSGNRDGSPSPPRSISPPPSSSQDSNIGLIIGVPAGAGLLLILLLVLLCFCYNKKKKKKKKESPQVNHLHYYNNNPFGAPTGTCNGGYYNNGTPQDHVMNMASQGGGNWGKHSGNSNLTGATPSPQAVILGHKQSTFTYDELSIATEGFSQSNLLGQGGFGYVHKGVLPNGKEVAVKSLKLGSGQGEREFQAEVDIISRVHHRHLVSLVGYCISGGQRLLVYEFLPNYTLEFHLHGKGRPVMDWPTRLKIALGSARGLAYLHEDCHPRIIHRDIKAANILLDFSFETKVADFGLAKLSQDNNTHVSTRVMGTFGYLAPEYASSGKLSDKSDVFSFGVMLLELVTGKPPIDLTGEMEDSLVEWARPLCLKAAQNGDYRQIADPRLETNYDKKEMAIMASCAAASVRHSARRRPKMSQIVRALEGDVSMVDISEGVIRRGLSPGSVSSEYDASSYSADMNRIKKLAFEGKEYESSEFGLTSEYGLNISASSSEEMHRGSMKRHNTQL
ncbi:unnamed protein product [Cochlearia groenlandica]